MTDTTMALRFRERRVQLMVAGGLAMILALGAMVARNERALFVDGSSDPKAFGALAVAPTPPVGSLKRFGWVPRDVLARDFAPVRSAALPLAPRRQALGGSGMPDEEAFAGPVVPIDALPMTADALGLSGPAPLGSLPGPVFASAGGGIRAGGGGGSTGAGGGGGGAGSGGAGGSEPAATTPVPAETATPNPTPTPATGSESPPTTTPTTDVGVATPSTGAGVDPVVPIDVSYQPPSVDGPMLQPPPDDWPTSWHDPFETSEPPPSTETPATTADPITPVPEPSTWAMLLVGFTLVGWMVRGRRVGRGLQAA